MRHLALGFAALLGTLAFAAEPAVAPAWKGTSLCTVKPSRCHDEIIVYRFTAGSKPGGWSLAAAKIIDGQEESMGDALDCTLEGKTLTCPIPKAVFKFTLDGALMHGTLHLTDGTLYRRVELERMVAAPADAGAKLRP